MPGLLDVLTAPAQFMTAQPPATPQLGLLGRIHNAIDPVQAFGGYGGLLAMGLPPMARGPMGKGTVRFAAPKALAEAEGQRPSLDLRGADVFHYTDKAGAADIAKRGYRQVGEGYYGEAVSFTPEERYARNFGDVRTVGRVAKDARILDLMNAKDSEIAASILNDPRNVPIAAHKRPGQKTWAEAFRARGYDGLYDPGAGDLFIYNPAKVTYRKLR